jgi:hypothetical protein
MKIKKVKVCRCGHSEEVHKHNRRGTDCSKCRCLKHPLEEIGLYNYNLCQMYPELCRGLCYSFKDQRSLLTRFFDLFRPMPTMI